MPDQQECALELIGTKDRLHRIWFDLQMPPKTIKRDFSTLIDRAMADDILAKAEKALAFAAACGVRDSIRQITQGYLDSAKKRRLGWEKERFMGANYYSAPPDSAQEFLITDLNYIINTIHNMGASLLQATGKYAGCYNYGDFNSINRGSMAFCEGVPTHHGSRIGHLLNGGERVEEELGCHKAAVDITEGDSGYDVALDFSAPPGYISFKERLDGVQQHLEDDFGLTCQGAGASIRCRGAISELDALRQMAYFFDSISDVDLLVHECVPKAMDHAWEHSKEAVRKFGAEAWTVKPEPSGHDDWIETVCPEIYAGIEAIKKQEAIGVLEADIEQFKIRSYELLDQSRAAPCGIDQYRKLRDSYSFITDAAWNCQELAKRTGAKKTQADCFNEFIGPWEDQARPISQGILAGCRPEPLIEADEARFNADLDLTSSLEYAIIKYICQLAEDEPCLDALHEAVKRHDVRGSLATFEYYAEDADKWLNKADAFSKCSIERFTTIQQAAGYRDSALTYCHAAASKQAGAGPADFSQCDQYEARWNDRARGVSQRTLDACRTQTEDMINLHEERYPEWADFRNAEAYKIFDLVCRLAGDQPCLDSLQNAAEIHDARMV